MPDPSSVHISRWLKLQARVAPLDRLLRAREASEDDEVTDAYLRPIGDDETDQLLSSICKDERSYEMAVDEMSGAALPSGHALLTPQDRLQRLLRRGLERHRVQPAARGGGQAGWQRTVARGGKDAWQVIDRRCSQEARTQ